MRTDLQPFSLKRWESPGGNHNMEKKNANVQEISLTRDTEALYVIYRILALLLFSLLFLPAVNPGRISALISKSTSLLTA